MRTIDFSHKFLGWWIWIIIIISLIIFAIFVISIILVIRFVWKRTQNDDSNFNNRRPDTHVGPQHPEEHIPLNQDDYIEDHPTESPSSYEGPRSNKDYFEDDFNPIDKELQYGEGYGEEKPEINGDKTRDMSGVTIKPISSFGKADRTAPPRSPLNHSSPVHIELQDLSPHQSQKV